MPPRHAAPDTPAPSDRHRRAAQRDETGQPHTLPEPWVRSRPPGLPATVLHALDPWQRAVLLRHLNRWRFHGRPPIQEFLAWCKSNGGPRFDLRALTRPGLRLNFSMLCSAARTRGRPLVRADNTHFLITAARHRSATTHQRVVQALRDLAADGTRSPSTPPLTRRPVTVAAARDHPQPSCSASRSRPPLINCPYPSSPSAPMVACACWRCSRARSRSPSLR